MSERTHCKETETFDFWTVVWMACIVVGAVVSFLAVCLIGTLMVLGAMWLWQDLFPEAARQNIL